MVLESGNKRFFKCCKHILNHLWQKQHDSFLLVAHSTNKDFSWVRYSSTLSKLSETIQNVRVRFAPSPTGQLHLGGLRTALYNYLFAKKHKGMFILRIEDTDQTRLVPGAVEQLENMLSWTGIRPDEGPSSGGHHGPYVQSQRLSLYKEKAKDLLENGTAYRCFCTESRLKLLRKEALRLREIPKYDNRCRGLSTEEIQARLKENQPYVVRFKLEDGPLTFLDQIYGPITLNISETEGDPVIIKSDGYPTYHLACVVDDYSMEISHVLRGVEWQVSTPKHLMMYQAFGWTPPVFAHLPLLLNRDGTKLSKRQGDIHVENFKNEGYFPEAVINFIVNIGGGFGKHQRKLFPIEELIVKFNLEKVNVNSCRIEVEKMKDYNRQHLQHIMEDENNLQDLVNQLKNLVLEKFTEKSHTDLSDKHLKKILLLNKDRMDSIYDLLSPHMNYLWVTPTVNAEIFRELGTDSEKVVPMLLSRLELLKESEFTRQELTSVLKDVSNQIGLKYNLYMKFLRSVLSNLKEGPAVVEMMEMLGKETCILRLQDVLGVARENNKKHSYHGPD
ncbi:probable glutamate--tRNA ligase, mitochondrial isoform X1 [Limulus polyphemus]|uniref:Nondiscriminating glutamyl-tRNA synthetase EARS2, mitochondrial n=1 Tax=Limulus polyphemus TaxID=6850 RepID=A0ABM1BQX2_LIMPO|nr:probable glutamate--tRNA ligase, mitochondrial isoform X2 [Limulus polyphemus]XP_022255242.1 probable glutamate--tRNA ligase, mitochondrial isoform X1 [Limulus polyphemus]